MKLDFFSSKKTAEQKTKQDTEADDLLLFINFSGDSGLSPIWLRHNNYGKLTKRPFKHFYKWYYGREQSESFELVSSNEKTTILRKYITSFSTRSAHPSQRAD